MSSRADAANGGDGVFETESRYAAVPSIPNCAVSRRGCTRAEIEEKLDILRDALSTGDDETVRNALKRVAPTCRDAEEVNREAETAEKMKESK